MYQVQQRGKPGFEDLMRELEVFEHELMKENGDMAMNLMVLEAKIRERFQQLEGQYWERVANIDLTNGFTVESDLSPQDIQAMIPRDLPTAGRLRRPTLETVSMAAILAVLTATGVFGLASLLQLVLSWVA